MKIVVLEKIERSKAQTKRLEQLGRVDWFESSSDDEIPERIRGADVVLVDWIDPSGFILSMKSPSLVALMSTGYGWIQHRDEARKQGILISNVPEYATEAVAEHLIGLALCVARQTMVGDHNLRTGRTEKGYLEGVELKGRRMGIIGFGKIGRRVAEISRCLGMEVVAHTRHREKRGDVPYGSLGELLSSSDVICVSCPLNNESRGMLNKDSFNTMKRDAILVAATWNIIVLDDLIEVLQNHRIRGVGLDVAVEGGKIELPKELLNSDRVVLTPHVGFNTVEAKTRQVNECFSNIEAFITGNPKNVVN